MELADILGVISDVLLTIGIIGTVIILILFLIAVLFNVKNMNKLVVLLSIMFIFIWIMQIGCSTYLLLGKDYSTSIESSSYKKNINFYNS
jgi:hypothetical protein